MYIVEPTPRTYDNLELPTLYTLASAAQRPRRPVLSVYFRTTCVVNHPTRLRMVDRTAIRGRFDNFDQDDDTFHISQCSRISAEECKKKVNNKNGINVFDYVSSFVPPYSEVSKRQLVSTGYEHSYQCVVSAL